MELKRDQIVTAFHGACFALRFLLDEECHENARKQMAGFSDAAIFHRWMDLAWTLDQPDVLVALAPEERMKVIAFKDAFDALPWRPIDTHPFISDLANESDELGRLLPAADELLELLQTRISLSKA